MARTLAQFISLKRTGLSRMRTNHNHNCRIRPAMLRLEDRTVPAVFTVTNTDDNGAGSLRQAVIDANANLGADAVDATGVNGTITLTTGQLVVSDALTITGPGPSKLTVSGNHQTRIMDIHTAPTGASIALSGLTLTAGSVSGGERGGAIWGTAQKVTLTNCTLSDNTTLPFGVGGAVSLENQPSRLDAINCTFVGNSAVRGGAIDFYSYGSGIVTLEGCTLANNSAQAGGGIFAYGKLSLDGCTISENVASGPGGGLVSLPGSATVEIRNSTIANNTASQGGGAVLHAASSTLLANSTFSGNHATDLNGSGGGVFVDQYAGAPTFVVQNCTFSGNITAAHGGGLAVLVNPYGLNLTIYNSTFTANVAGNWGGGLLVNNIPAMSLVSTVVSGNSASTGVDIYDNTGVKAQNSAIGNRSGINSFIDQGGNLAEGTDLKLGPLSGNGGPTLTHLLLPGSPAIDAGVNPTNLMTDQRGSGFARVSGKAVDIGAIEVQGAPRVQFVLINGGAIQRSRVTSVQLFFGQFVTLPANPEQAFQLRRQGDDALIELTANVSNTEQTIVTLSFGGSLCEFGSLPDGRYTLTIDASKVSNALGQLDGNGDGMGGDDYVLASADTPNAPTNIFRFFGDADGNGTINSSDFTALRTVFGLTGPSIFDFNGDNRVDANDFAEFRKRFGLMI